MSKTKRTQATSKRKEAALTTLGMPRNMGQIERPKTEVISTSRCTAPTVAGCPWVLLLATN